MRISISGDRIKVTTDLHGYIERCLYFALGRFGSAIDHISVRVGDVNGPRGGVDKRCLIVVKLQTQRGNPVIIDENGDALYPAISHACDRAGRTVGRAIERQRCKKPYRRQRLFREEAQLAMEVHDQESPE